MTPPRSDRFVPVLALLLLFAACIRNRVDAFLPLTSLTTRRDTTASTKITTQLGLSNGDPKQQQQQQDKGVNWREQQTRLALVEAQLALPKAGSNALQEVFVVGQARLPTSSRRRSKPHRYRSCIVLSTSNVDDSSSSSSSSKTDPIPALLLPLTTNENAQLKLLQFVKANRPLSKSVLLGLNALLVNRDGALFDNLPWAIWSVDPQQRNYDAANNPIDAKFHLGKRDAYNRLMGKDWQGRSVSIGNMALRLKYMLEADESESTNGNDSDNTENKANNDGNDFGESFSVDDATSQISLAQRILELQIKELKMDMAEKDYQMAIARNNNDLEALNSSEADRQALQRQLNDTQQKLDNLLQEQEGSSNDGDNKSSSSKGSNIVTSILQDVADWTTDNGRNEAPYRGAIGYAPMLDSKKDIEGSTLPYTSPYDLLKEILDDQLNCEVIGSILENTSLMEGTLALGGAIVLRRKTAKKTVTLAGEEVTINDEEEDYGNVDGKGGETMLIECDADEALAMGYTCKVPIHLEPGIWDRTGVMVKPIPSLREDIPRLSIRESLPLWTTLDPELSFLEEGQAGNESVTERSSPLRIPRTTTSLFDSIFETTPSDAPSGLFPTDNPIQSLNQYDELSSEGKARTLMSLSNFQGRLPRPRVLRQEEQSGSAINSLDDLLLLLIDESVRRQYLMRDAELRGDMERLEELRNEKTKRQIAQEKAEDARERGDEEAAAFWEAEADFYGDLRADVTQDEGAYSRFLDRDEWYERSRRAQAKKLEKKKFGTLLDGIE